VCVGASDSTSTSDDPFSRDVCVVCARRFPRGVLGGGKYAPPAYAQHPDFFFFGRFLLFLAVF
jgi:hypothetical protein